MKLLCAGVWLAFFAGSTATLTASPVTFNRDIAPILYDNCASCHHPGESAPFSLLTYQDAKAHARQIVAVTKSRFMPPWLPEPGDFHFADERRLTAEQIRTLAQWVADGVPEGDPRERRATPHFDNGWQLGPPDLVLKAKRPYSLPPSGSDTYWNFILPVPVEGERWVKAIEIRPGDKRLVHHANIMLDRLESARAMEKVPGAGFAGMELRVESEAFDPDSHFLFWKPGSVPKFQPDDMALRISKGTDLLLNMHLQPSGKPESIQPSIGLYFTDRPAKLRPMLLEMENDAALKIPAGNREFVVTDTFTLPIAVDLLAIYPHAHYLGRDLLATASLPDGTTKTLIHIKRWDLNWQGVFGYAEPVVLPSGTTIRMKYSYDNSAANAANPHHPPQLVSGGNRAEDEMAHLWLQVLPHEDRTSGSDGRLALQEALSRHQAEQDPGNFEAQYNLAAMLLNRGDSKGALTYYVKAASLRPNDFVVLNALGTAQLTNGNLQAAIDKFRSAIHTRSDYFDAHYNLGLALGLEGDFKGAESEFRESARLKPEDANAHANLGAALGQVGDLVHAKEELRTALKLDPDNKLARENLSALDGK